jgi:ubiquinone/menaquinone biosynthesis C-methylase UbiE
LNGISGKLTLTRERERERPVDPNLYTEAYFRTACEGFDEFNETDGERLSRRLSAAFELAEVTAGMTALDVGCGRGEILRHCARLGADAFGIDYAAVAVKMSQDVIGDLDDADGHTGIALADAKKLPFPDRKFDRVLMFDVVEHLHPWELHEALLEVRRVMKDDGKFIIHTAPNIWYDRYAYPVVRLFRRMAGQGEKYPRDPRQFLVDHNEHVHVNEQSMFSMGQALKRAGFQGKVWLESPPQNRNENFVLAGLRKMAFETPPLRWFFEREVFAVAGKK